MADACAVTNRVQDVAALIELLRATLVNIHQSVAIAIGLEAVGGRVPVGPRGAVILLTGARLCRPAQRYWHATRRSY